jgi:4-carboxymuconolactone decarboxylase
MRTQSVGRASSPPELTGDEEALRETCQWTARRERTKGRSATMTNEPSPAQRMIGDVAPKLVELTDEVLFGDIWERPGLSKRDRSLVTVAALIALYRTNELPGHLRRALENGVGRDELIELITHLAFYAGWPTAMSAMRAAKEVFAGIQQEGHGD